MIKMVSSSPCNRRPFAGRSAMSAVSGRVCDGKRRIKLDVGASCVAQWVHAFSFFPVTVAVT